MPWHREGPGGGVLGLPNNFDRHIDWTEVNADFDEFARRLHITEFFHDYTTDHQSDPFHPKSLWTPSIAETTRLMITSIQRC